MSVELSLLLLAGLTFLVGGYGMRRYGTPLNPLTLFACLPIGIFTLFSGVVSAFLTPERYSPAMLSLAAQISMVYVAGVSFPYLFRGSLPARVFSRFLRLFGLDSERIATRFSYVHFFALLAGAAVSLLLVAVIGGGGVRWLLDPRSAYQSFRFGAGPFWVMTQWFLVFAWLYFLWACRPRAVKLVLVLGFFCFLAYYTGSKNNILIHAVIAVVYYNFLVKPIRPLALVAMALAGFAGIIALLVVQNFEDTVLALAYFDFFGMSAYTLSRFDEFGFQYGKIWASALWFFVPRALYPDKPYEYGATLLNSILFPGAAELGHTPGILGWTPAYLDFGVAGVFVHGAVQGLWQRMAYEHFFRRPSFFSFFFMVHLALWPVMTFAPLILVLIWSVAQAIFLRLVWRKGAVRGAVVWPAERPLPLAR